MFRSLPVIIFIITFPLLLVAQILPKEGSNLNYRIVGFSFPGEGGKVTHEVEIAEGSYTDDVSFKKSIVITSPGTVGKIIALVPSFGKEYTWRVVYRDNNACHYSGLHHFSTMALPEAGIGPTRLRVITSAAEYKDAYVFMDGGKAMYDMKGEELWFLPERNGPFRNELTVRDLKVSAKNTMTMLLDDPVGVRAFETDLNGNVLWEAPNDGKVSGEKTEYYHHEFTRLSNGHYFVLGGKFDTVIAQQGSGPGGQAPPQPGALPGGLARNLFGTVIEYDEHGKVFWVWYSAKYYKASDLPSRKSVGTDGRLGLHDNSFYFDQKDSGIYISFRNVSRVIKIKYPEGNVINTYGEQFGEAYTEKGNGIFNGQHSARHSDSGYVYLFNNNVSGNDSVQNPLPTIELIYDKAVGENGMETKWAYTARPEETHGKNAKGKEFEIGGNVLELPGGGVFALVLGVQNEVFIVNKKKEVLWDAVLEKKEPGIDEWKAVQIGYRASIVTNHKDIEKLIWSAEGYAATKINK